MTRILVVEPTAVIREPLCAALAHHGFEADAAANAAEGLKQALSRRPDLILTELLLPDLPGTEFLKRVRASRALAETPVLVLSSATDRQLIRLAVGLTISGYLLKSGFSLGGLLERIRALTCGGGGSSAPRPAVRSEPTTSADAPAASPPDAEQDDPDTQAEVLSRLRPILPRTEIDDCLSRLGEMRALSPSVAHLMKLTARSSASADQVVEAVKMDHAVAVKVLKLANSSVFTRGEPVDSIKKAVLRIGTTEIRQVVLNIAVIDRFTNPELDKLLDCRQFWEHSIACGVIAADLARSFNRKDADQAFTLGLLHDVGRMILAEQLGDRYAHVMRTARELNLPLEQVEKRLLGVSHADIMERVLTRWNFPGRLASPIVHHHLSAGMIRKVAPRELFECGMLALANALAQALMLGTSGTLTISPATDLGEMIGVDPRVASRIVERAPEQTNNIKFAMLATGNVETWPQVREQVRASLGGPFRPLYVAPPAAVDALKVFLDRLADPPGDEPPNIAVVRIPSARDAGPLCKSLLDAETRAGVMNLPLVLVSPTGKLELDGSTLAGRSVRRLASPFSAARFIDRVKGLMPKAETALAAAA